MAGRGETGRIGHTQPRRIAASSIAKRIAEELKTPLGDVVGYKVRFTDQTASGATIKLMTDGILLAETQGIRCLKRMTPSLSTKLMSVRSTSISCLAT